MSIPGLDAWLSTAAGRYVLDWEQRQLDAADLGEFDVAELHEFLDRIQLALADLHGQVDRAYFTAPNLTPA